MIEAIGVQKHFGMVHALRDVTFQVRTGEVVVIIGASGSGKSTLLRCINHLERLDGGRIYVDGQLVGYREATGRLVSEPDRVVARQRADIGMVFQSLNLFQHLTAAENVMCGPVYVRRVDRARARAEALELLARVGLEDKVNSHPAQLSGGQQQRVAIARALAMRPKVMLFDEPTSALDPEMVTEVLDVIRQLARSGMTLMIVSHEMDFAREVGQRIMFMDEGKILEEGPPARFFTSPMHPRCRAFLQKILRSD